jgi:hypothetical protein
MKGVGDGMDSEGSEWIVEMLEKDDDRPLWISTWTGINTVVDHFINSTFASSVYPARNRVV